MASNTHLNIIIDAQNKTNQAFSKLDKGLGKLEKNVQKMTPTFEKMAVAGTVGLGAVVTGLGFAVKEASIAEGSFNKFNTVFADLSDDMLLWVDDIRQEMPLATHEIVRMSADLQDLLVPMGLSRELSAEMTRGFVDLANKVSAFNDVDPSEVINAIGSALAGSSEPLRRFGINALDSSVELEALEMGLLRTGEKLNSLDAITRNQVKAQALLSLATKQSADAINGFADNNDSFIRRSQNLKATLKEINKSLGDIFLPSIDNFLKVITPVIERIEEWVDENPKLAGTIITIATALIGLVAVVGIVGLALSKLLVAFRLLRASSTFMKIFNSIVAVAPVVVSVITAVIGAFTTLLAKIRESKLIQDVFIALGQIFSVMWNEMLKPAFMEFTTAIRENILENEFLMSVLRTLGEIFGGALLISLGLVVAGVTGLIFAFSALITWITKTMTTVINFVGGLIGPVATKLGKFADFVGNVFIGAFGVIEETVKSVIRFVIDAINTGIRAINTLINKIKSIPILGKRLKGIGSLEFLELPNFASPEPVRPTNRAPSSIGTTININGGIFGSDAGEEIGDQIIKKLKLNAQL